MTSPKEQASVHDDLRDLLKSEGVFSEISTTPSRAAEHRAEVADKIMTLFTQYAREERLDELELVYEVEGGDFGSTKPGHSEYSSSLRLRDYRNRRIAELTTTETNKEPQ